MKNSTPRRSVLISCTFLFALSLPQSSVAGPPPNWCGPSGSVKFIDLSTGTRSNIKLPSAGMADLKWSLAAVPAGGTPGPAYFVGAVGPWVPNAPQPANWIARIQSTTTAQTDVPGNYTYRLVLNPLMINGPFSSAQVMFRYAADNSTSMTIGGVPVPLGTCAGPNCFSAWQPTTGVVQVILPTALPSTPYNFDVTVNNQAGSNSYTGLIVNAQLRLVCQ